MANSRAPTFSSQNSAVDKKSLLGKSRHSARVTFPSTTRLLKKSSHKCLPSEEVKVNPFQMPPDSLIFMLRDRERQLKKQERVRQRKLRVHEKTTYSSRVNFRPVAMIHPVLSDEEEDREDDRMSAARDEQQLAIAVTRDRHVDKESLAEYIAKKREMFLVQYSLGVKRDEMRKLEEIAQAEERKLELAEQFLEEDAAMFDEFLKENDKNSVEAIKIAEAEGKAKMEKVQEIRKITSTITAIKSEIAKLEETLKEYRNYKEFLDMLTPPEMKGSAEQHRHQHKVEEKKQKEQDKAVTTIVVPPADHRLTPTDTKHKKKGSSGRSQASPTSARKSPQRVSISRKKSHTDKTPSRSTSAESSTETAAADLEVEEDMELYFTDPNQLLDMFSELEEHCLSLIQNSQETEETLEEMKTVIKTTRKKMNRESSGLKEQIEKLQKMIGKENRKTADLQVKTKMFAVGDAKPDNPERGLQSIDQTVREVYRSCVGDNEASISTLQMMTSIETHLEELFQIIETIPTEKVQAAEKMKEKERRLKMREEKLEEQRLYQEERLRRALERAKAEPKKVTGKKMVYRSEPPEMKKKVDDGADRATREEQEYAYFFQW